MKRLQAGNNLIAGLNFISPDLTSNQIKKQTALYLPVYVYLTV